MNQPALPTVLPAIFLALVAAAHAQTSPLYTTEHNGTNGAILQGGVVIGTFTTMSPGENGLAIADTMRIIASNVGQTGREYDLMGNPIPGSTYTNPSYNDIYDGATDGVMYNYGIDHNGSQDVIRFDRNWQNGVRMFSHTTHLSGIAYDTTDDTLWVTACPGDDTVRHYDLTGNLLGVWPYGLNLAYAIALDPADGTLWLSEHQGSPAVFEQRDKQGNLLQTMTIPTLFSGPPFGLEFSVNSFAAIRTVTSSATDVAPGQSGVAVSYDVENTGMNALTVTSTDLRFTSAMGMDRTSDYTVTPAPGNPTSIPVGGTVTMDFSVDVAAMAALGTITVDGMIEVTDSVTMTTARDQSADTPHTWDVVGAVPVIRVIDATPARVAPGTTAHMVSMTVENVGANPLQVTSANLSFADASATDVTAEYTVFADPGNPTTIAPGATASFAFLVDVAILPTLGNITIDGEVQAIDTVSMGMIDDLGADVPDSWTVESAVVHIRTVDALATTVSPGSAGHQVTVTVENPGLVTLLFGAIGLTFHGTVDRTAEYTVTPDPGNPPTIAPGATETYSLLVDVHSTAAFETITIDAAFSGFDTSLGGLVWDVDADTVDQWDVVMCGVTLCGDCNGDGQLSIVDALQGAQHASGLITLTGINFTSCNVIGALEPDPGASVSIIDALTIAQAVAGLPATLMCC